MAEPLWSSVFQNLHFNLGYFFSVQGRIANGHPLKLHNLAGFECGYTAAAFFLAVYRIYIAEDDEWALLSHLFLTSSLLWSCRDDSAGKTFATKPDDVNLVPGTHMFEGDNHLLRVASDFAHVLGNMRMQTQNKYKCNRNDNLKVLTLILLIYLSISMLNWNFFLVSVGKYLSCFY